MSCSLHSIALSGLLVFTCVDMGRAELEYRVKSDGVSIFKSSACEPPPMAVLAQGDVLTLVQNGATTSSVKTAGGLQGWMRNEDILAVQIAAKHAVTLATQKVGAEVDWNHSFTTLIPPVPMTELISLDRSFTGEIAEAADREQVEMRHDEN